MHLMLKARALLVLSHFREVFKAQLRAVLHFMDPNNMDQLFGSIFYGLIALFHEVLQELLKQ